MLNLGLICPELTGHLNPLTTLGLELKKRGHRVTVVARLDGRQRVEDAGINFVPIGEKDFPLGEMQVTSAKLGKLRGLAAIRFTAGLLKRAADAILKEAPAVAKKEGFDAMIVDQVSATGATVADQMGLPHVLVCNAMAMNLDPDVPPGMTHWPYSPSAVGRARNAMGNAVLRWVAKPVIQRIDRYRIDLGLPALGQTFTTGSALAEIAQQPAFFDYPRRLLSRTFHYTGPWHHGGNVDPTAFPWDRLDGRRPLIYASMGTLQNRLDFIFSTIAEACAGLEAQVVISLGSRDQNAEALAATFPGDPIVVPFAPQLQLLERASLVITHAGLNTALESLSHGLPMVAIPMANDQPGVASRLDWLGVAEVIQPTRLNAFRLRSAIFKVLSDPSYRENARQRQAELLDLNGVARAADIVEKAFTTRQPVLRDEA